MTEKDRKRIGTGRGNLGATLVDTGLSSGAGRVRGAVWGGSDRPNVIGTSFSGEEKVATSVDHYPPGSRTAPKLGESRNVFSNEWTRSRSMPFAAQVLHLLQLIDCKL